MNIEKLSIHAHAELFVVVLGLTFLFVCLVGFFLVAVCVCVCFLSALSDIFRLDIEHLIDMCW